MRIHRSLLATAGVAAGIVLASAAPASAHVGIDTSEVAAGGSALLGFTVPHGCDGSPTTAVAIQIPESILTVSPQRNAFYDISIETEPLDEAVEGSHGEQITERDAVVTYTAREPLPEGMRDVLQISMSIPADAAGETLVFPTVQTCEAGETAWIEVAEEGQDPHDLESPAPSVAVVAGDADGGHGHGEDAEAGDHGATDEADVAESAADASDDSDDGDGPLPVVALVVGVAALGLGGAALVASRKTSGS